MHATQPLFYFNKIKQPPKVAGNNSAGHTRNWVRKSQNKNPDVPDMNA